MVVDAVVPVAAVVIAARSSGYRRVPKKTTLSVGFFFASAGADGHCGRYEPDYHIDHLKEDVMAAMEKVQSKLNREARGVHVQARGLGWVWSLLRDGVCVFCSA
jgi:hypothetical protein